MSSRKDELAAVETVGFAGQWCVNAGYLKSWGDLHRVAGLLRPMIVVSEHAWNLAQDCLGPQIATAALL